VELAAEWAEESEVPLGDLGREVEDLSDEVRDGDLVAEGP
jgi:hypothetical protein